MVNELRLECAERDSIGRKRTGAAVAWSLQRYLIFALLSCIPGTPRSSFFAHISFSDLLYCMSVVILSLHARTSMLCASSRCTASAEILKEECRWLLWA